MKIFMTIVAALSFSTLATAQTYEIKNAKVDFVAKGKPGFLKIEGTGSTANGTLTRTGDIWGGVVIADLLPIKTGIDLRDEHMHEKYLETKKFPTAKLTISKGTWKDGDCKFTGTLEVKGTANKTSGECDLESSANGIKGNVTFVFSLESYPVGVPSYLGITVADEVTINADFSAQEAKTTH